MSKFFSKVKKLGFTGLYDCKEFVNIQNLFPEPRISFETYLKVLNNPGYQTDPSKTRVEFQGLRVQITAFDYFGNLKKRGGDKFIVRIVSSTFIDQIFIPVEVHDHRNGNYTCFLPNLKTYDKFDLKIERRDMFIYATPPLLICYIEFIL